MAVSILVDISHLVFDFLREGDVEGATDDGRTRVHIRSRLDQKPHHAGVSTQDGEVQRARLQVLAAEPHRGP